MKPLITTLKDWRIWVTSVLFYSLLIAMATQRAYVMQLVNRPWLEIWLDYWPWYITWVFLAPVLIGTGRAVANWRSHWPKRTLLLLVMVMLFLAIHAGLGVATLVLMSWVMPEILANMGASSVEDMINIFFRYNAWHLDLQGQVYMILTGFGWGYLDRTRSEQKRRQQLRKQLREVELAALKSQLNPHFLFNTLNSITSLIRLGQKQKAINALSELGSMLRRVLEHQEEQLICLKQEMEFVQSYLAIQQLRFEDKLTTEVNIDESAMQEEIPFMLLQPLVENAVQHGCQMESNQNTLSLRVEKLLTELRITLVNIVPEHDDHKGFGIGMDNCKRRLQKHYPDNFSLTLERLPNRYFKTFLVIPCGEFDD